MDYSGERVKTGRPVRRPIPLIQVWEDGAYCVGGRFLGVEFILKVELTGFVEHMVGTQFIFTE